MRCHLPPDEAFDTGSPEAAFGAAPAGPATETPMQGEIDMRRMTRTMRAAGGTLALAAGLALGACQDNPVRTSPVRPP